MMGSLKQTISTRVKSICFDIFNTLSFILKLKVQIKINFVKNNRTVIYLFLF